MRDIGHRVNRLFLQYDCVAMNLGLVARAQKFPHSAMNQGGLGPDAPPCPRAGGGEPR
jgi:hypothetical protein